jgi:excisionase family DNA binding protein
MMKSSVSTVVSTVSTTEAAARLGVTSQTIRRWCETGGFGVRLAGRWRISENRIAEIEQNLVACSSGMPSCGTASAQ